MRGFCPKNPPLSKAEGEDNKCLWKIPRLTDQAVEEEVNNMEELSSEDRPCKCCRNLCSFFPVETVATLEDYQTPCISREERIKILSSRRDPRNNEKWLTRALQHVLMQPSVTPSRDFSYLCLSYDNEEIAADILYLVVLM